nr:NBS-LRR disease resistance protein [Dasypyrum villosum]
MAEAVLVALGKIGNVLADEATKALLAKLSEKVSNLIDLDDKIEGIAKQLKTMNNVIQQIGTPYLADKVVKGWIGEVRKLAYHVEDVMDKYSYHSLHVEKGFLKKCLKGSHYVRVFSQIADEVVKIEKEIKQVIELKEQWLQPSQLVHDPHTEMERQRSQDNFPELVKDEDLIGIEDNRQMMTEWLYSDEMETTVITVSGMGGLGKTTLVTNVYEREKVNFQTSAWMVVSQTYTLEALLRKLLEKVAEQPSSPNIDRMDVHDLKEEIKRKLKDRKCLIVLDDVWKKEVYSQMRDAFQNSHASRIIITTRNNHVAAIAHSTRRIDLKPLGNAHAFELFCRRVFYIKKDHEYECPNHLMKTARSIVDRCQGLPLAILSIGGLLSSRPQTQYSWGQIYNQLSTELSNNDHLRAVLNLSYHDLSGDLRNCLLYCSLFPEDYPMSRESLVRLWVAEGFVCSKGNSIPEEVAEENLMELIYRNMLEVKETDELGRVSTCMMHDIVRDLALCVASEEQFVCANDYATLIHMNKDVRRLSSCGWKGNTALKIKLPLSSESSYLTVLELQDSEITEVPAWIGTLFNLRYIGLRRTKVRDLPRGIAKIKNLRHLLADRYADEKQTEFRYFIGIQAPKELPNIEGLQTLETIQANKDLAGQLERMVQLRTLWIDNISSAECANIFAALSNMPLLSSLLLAGRDENEALCFEALQPMSAHLHKLIIRGKWAKGTLDCPIFRSHGENLKYLALSCANILVLSADSFPHLKSLTLKHMHNVNELKIIDGALPCIEGLYVVSLSKLDKVPRGIEIP